MISVEFAGYFPLTGQSALGELLPNQFANWTSYSFIFFSLMVSPKEPVFSVISN